MPILFGNEGKKGEYRCSCCGSNPCRNPNSYAFQQSVGTTGMWWDEGTPEPRGYLPESVLAAPHPADHHREEHPDHEPVWVWYEDGIQKSRPQDGDGPDEWVCDGGAECEVCGFWDWWPNEFGPIYKGMPEMDKLASRVVPAIRECDCNTPT